MSIREQTNQPLRGWEISLTETYLVAIRGQMNQPLRGCENPPCGRTRFARPGSPISRLSPRPPCRYERVAILRLTSLGWGYVHLFEMLPTSSSRPSLHALCSVLRLTSLTWALLSRVRPTQAERCRFADVAKASSDDWKNCTLVWLQPEKAYQKSKVTRKFVNKNERESAKIRAYFEARLTLLPNTPK